MRRLALALGLAGLILAGLLGPASALALPPVATTGTATGVTATAATVNGTLDPAGQATTYQFAYGTTTSYGQTTPSQSLAAGAPPTAVTAPLSSLTPGTTYHFRLSVITPSGTTPGLDQTFTTDGPAAVHTGAATAVTATTAVLQGTVTFTTSPVYTFQYGTTTAYGQQTPPLGIGAADVPPPATVPVSNAITGLSPATTYHYRITATTSAGTTNGADQTFVTPGTATASILGVIVNPAGGDADLATNLSIGSDPSGNPVGEVASIGYALPAEFANRLVSFGVCAAVKFANVQGPTAANCPDRSAILGIATLVTRDQTGAEVTSDQGFAVKTADNQIVLWWHTPAKGAVPEGFAQVTGAVTQQTGVYGPAVAYDLSTLPAGTRVKQLTIVYQRSPTTGRAPFAAAACASGSWRFQAAVAYRGSVAPELPIATVACGTAPAPQPSKLALARATITGRVIDILAPISRRASGNVSLDLNAAGQHFHWSAPINSTDGRIRDTQLLPASQANNGGTGILTIKYAGNAVTRPQVVRLRAASLPAQLDASRPTLVGGHLLAHGTISTLARGVVRVQLEYYSNGQTTTLERYAPVSNGVWSLDYTLTAAQQTAVAARRGTVESYILFTGYFARRMRGEMIAYQVLGGP